MLFCLRIFIIVYVQYVLRRSVIFSLCVPYASRWLTIFCLYVPCASRRSVIYFYIPYASRCQSFYAAGLKMVSYLLLCALCLKTCHILQDGHLSSSIYCMPQDGQSTCYSMCSRPQNIQSSSSMWWMS